MSKNTNDILVWQNAMFLVKQLPPERLYGLLNRVRKTTACVKADCLSIAQVFNYEIETQIKDAVELEYISTHQAEPVLGKVKELSTMLNTLHNQESYNGK